MKPNPDGPFEAGKVSRMANKGLVAFREATAFDAFANFFRGTTSLAMFVGIVCLWLNLKETSTPELLFMLAMAGLFGWLACDQYYWLYIGLSGSYEIASPELAEVMRLFSQANEARRGSDWKEYERLVREGVKKLRRALIRHPKLAESEDWRDVIQGVEKEFGKGVLFIDRKVEDPEAWEDALESVAGRFGGAPPKGDLEAEERYAKALLREYEQRRAERTGQQGDSEPTPPVATVPLLRSKLETGELTEAHVELAASLGHAAALMLFPNVDQYDWAGEHHREAAVEAACDLLGDTLPARVAADWAERALPVWEAHFPGDMTARDAIAAARAWAICPCERHRQTVGAAATAADDAWGGGGVGSTAAAYALSAAGDAADAAVYAAASNSPRALKAAVEGAGAAVAAVGTPAHATEREWQRRRLLAYVLGAVRKI